MGGVVALGKEEKNCGSTHEVGEEVAGASRRSGVQTGLGSTA